MRIHRRQESSFFLPAGDSSKEVKYLPLVTEYLSLLRLNTSLCHSPIEMSLRYIRPANATESVIPSSEQQRNQHSHPIGSWGSCSLAPSDISHLMGLAWEGQSASPMMSSNWDNKVNHFTRPQARQGPEDRVDRREHSKWGRCLY